MDLKTPGWYGRIEIEGIAGAQKFEGSITSIFGQLLGVVLQAKPRTNSAGDKRINITLADVPLSDARVEELRKAQEVVALIDPSHQIHEWKAFEGEDMAAMTLRLVHTEQMSPGEADFWAREAFGYPPDPNMQRRVNDTRVQRFLHLNASDRRIEEADPKEYDSLKAYVQEAYPDYYKLLTPRR